MKPKISHAIALSILSGVLIGTSYIPFPSWWVSVCWVPLLLVWSQWSKSSQVPLRYFFWTGWIAQSVLSLIGFHWIKTTAVEFGHFPEWAGYLVLLAFAGLVHLYFPIAAVIVIWGLRRAYGQSPIPTGLFLASTGFIYLFLESIWPSIFPWHLGYTWLWMEWPGAQLGEWIGFEGINILVLAANFALAYCFSLSSPKKRALSALGALALFFALPQFLALDLKQKERSQWTHRVHTMIVQGNVGNFEKLIAERQSDFALPLIEKYLRLSREGLSSTSEGSVDWVIWPETAFASYLNPHYTHDRFQSALYGSLRSMDPKGQILWITGAYSRPQGSQFTYNGLFALNSQLGLTQDPYHKSVLIPFGERFPFSDWIPYQKWLFPGLGSFGQGPGPTLWRDPKDRASLGPQICLESLYPRFAAGASRLGADVLINITNDSWFGHTFEPYQHLTMTAARAIETRRPLIRATNTGISTVILSDGSLLTQSPMNLEWHSLFEVQFKKDRSPTFYSGIAGYSPYLSVLMLFVFGLFAFRQHRGTKRV